MASHFRNNPSFTANDGEQKIKRYVHSKLSVDHNGIQTTIHENGKVTYSKPVKDEKTNEIVFDEITIPASLVFKTASLLKATRKVQYLGVSEIQSQNVASTESEEEN